MPIGSSEDCASWSGSSVRSNFWASLARPFDQHVHRAADELVDIFFADLVLHRQQFIVAAAFHVFRHVVGPHFGSFGARPLAVFENEAVFEPRLADQVHRLLKIVFGFAAKADDKIAGHGGVRNSGANARHHFAIIFHRVPALHSLQNCVRAALGRHVQVRRTLGQIAHRLQQVVGHVFGKIRDKL